MRKYSVLEALDVAKVATENDRQFLKDKCSLEDEEIENLIFQKSKISNNMVILKTFDSYSRYEVDTRPFTDEKALKQMIVDQIRNSFKKEIQWGIAHIIYKGQRIEDPTDIFRIVWTDKLKMIDDSSKFGL